MSKSSSHRRQSANVIIALLGSNCTVPQIRSFLEDATGDRHRGSKEELLEAAKHVIRGNPTLTEAALRLGLQGEEEGRQYVYLYAPKSNDLRDWYLDEENVKDGLFGQDSDLVASFPLLTDMPSGDAQWIDFRTEGLGARVGWLAKLYVRYQVIVEKEVANSNGHYQKVTEDRRAVVTARLRKHPEAGRHLLDLRVGRIEHSRGLIEEVLAQFWANASGGIDRQDFSEYRLNRHLTKITEAELRGENQGFMVWDPNVVDSTGWGYQLSGKGRGAGRDPSDRLNSAVDRKTALRTLIENGSGRFPVDKLILQWDPGNPMPNGQSRIMFGMRGINSVLVGAWLSRAAIDHVLWEVLSR